MMLNTGKVCNKYPFVISDTEVTKETRKENKYYHNHNMKHIHMFCSHNW
jgi:hypothetical protein